MPPSQAGMVPASLPARIAPLGVSSVPLIPNLATSSSEGAWATAAQDRAMEMAAPTTTCCNLIILVSHRCSERILGHELHMITVMHRVIWPAAVDIVGPPFDMVRKHQRELVLMRSLDRQVQHVCAFQEVAASCWANTVQPILVINGAEDVEYPYTGHPKRVMPFRAQHDAERGRILGHPSRGDFIVKVLDMVVPQLHHQCGLVRGRDDTRGKHL